MLSNNHIILFQHSFFLQPCLFTHLVRFVLLDLSIQGTYWPFTYLVLGSQIYLFLNIVFLSSLELVISLATSSLWHSYNLQDIWIIVCKLLIHPHSMLRSISSSLVASYFATAEKRKREQKLDAPSWLLVQPSRLFIIAVSLLKQLRTELSDTTANNLIVHLIT